jgi:muconolactone delta-isomerase
MTSITSIWLSCYFRCRLTYLSGSDSPGCFEPSSRSRCRNFDQSAGKDWQSEAQAVITLVGTDPAAALPDSASVSRLKLSALPLFPFMQIKVTPLARHPSAIDKSG